MRRSRLLALSLLSAAFAATAAPPAPAAWPPMSTWVVDEAGLFTPTEAAQMREIAGRLDASGHAQLAVAALAELRGFERKEAAVELFKAWRLGHSKRASDGLLVLVHRTPAGKTGVKVEVGYGLEGTLPDGKVGALMDSAAGPLLREKKVGAGVLALVRALATVIDPSSLPAPQPDAAAPPPLPPVVYPLGVPATAVQPRGPPPGLPAPEVDRRLSQAWVVFWALVATLAFMTGRAIRSPWRAYCSDGTAAYGASVLVKLPPIAATAGEPWLLQRRMAAGLAAILRLVLHFQLDYLETHHYSKLSYDQRMDGPMGLGFLLFIATVYQLMSTWRAVRASASAPSCPQHRVLLRPLPVDRQPEAETVTCPIAGCGRTQSTAFYSQHLEDTRRSASSDSSSSSDDSSSGSGGSSWSSGSGGGSDSGGSSSASGGGGESGGAGADREY